MADPQRDHAAHDLELVARAAACDLAASEAIAARDLLAACQTCALLANDLRAIALATRALPDATARAFRTPAPRDFRLSAADAARLRPAGLAGLLRRIGGLGMGFGPRTQALGGAFVSLGLVGLLVSASVPALFGASGSAGGLETSIGPKGDLTHQPAVVPDASPRLARATDDGARAGEPARDTDVPAAPWAMITAASIIVTAAGVALVAIGWRGRRLRPDGT